MTAAVSSFVLTKTFESGLAKEIDTRTFLGGVLRPKRPRIDAVVAAVAGAKSGAEAWEGIASKGLVLALVEREPEAMLRRVRRVSDLRGHGPRRPRRPVSKVSSRARLVLATPTDAPLSVNAAVAIASLSEETLTALEALAWESAEALTCWGVPAPTRVCWCVATRDRWRRRGHDTVEPSTHASAACEAAGRGENALIRAFAAHPHQLPRRVRGERRARRPRELPRVEHRRARGAAPRHRSPVARGRLAARGDRVLGPRRPLSEARCAAWETGCAIDRVQLDGTVVIVVPV